MRTDEKRMAVLAAVIIGSLWTIFAVQKCKAEDVVYTSRENIDGSYTTYGSDGSRYISRPQATDDSWATIGTDVDGDSIYATTRTQPTDGSKVTTVRREKK